MSHSSCSPLSDPPAAPQGVLPLLCCWACTTGSCIPLFPAGIKRGATDRAKQQAGKAAGRRHMRHPAFPRFSLIRLLNPLFPLTGPQIWLLILAFCFQKNCCLKIKAMMTCISVMCYQGFPSQESHKAPTSYFSFDMISNLAPILASLHKSALMLGDSGSRIQT